jgi:hypothetical protein
MPIFAEVCQAALVRRPGDLLVSAPRVGVDGR